MFCTKCGNKITENAKFCVRCGCKVEITNNINKVFRKVYEFNSITNGGKTKVIIDDSKITILRPGLISKFSHGFVGEKTILIKDISSVQFKPVGIARGYLQFVFPGSKEEKSGIVCGSKGENIIYFDSGFNNAKINNNAKEIKRYIENYNSNPNFNNNITNIYNSTDKYDKLAKIKRLLDQGVLSQEEYDSEKKKILN